MACLDCWDFGKPSKQNNAVLFKTEPMKVKRGQVTQSLDKKLRATEHAQVQKAWSL